MSTEKHTHITTVKTLMTASIIYFFCSMAGGVFYREFTKLFDFTGKTTLGVIHGHLLVLGTFFFLLLAVLQIYCTWRPKTVPKIFSHL